MLMIGIIVFLSVSGVSASDTKKTFFHSEPVYRNVFLASFRKQPPQEKQMENVRGVYYIVDSSSFMKTDTERSGPYRSLGRTILVEEALITEKKGRNKK